MEGAGEDLQNIRPEVDEDESEESTPVSDPPPIPEGDNDSAGFQQLFSLLQEGTKHMLMNDFAQAEQRFGEAKAAASRRAQEHPTQPNLECFVYMIWVLSSVMRGLASLENNQLIQAIERLRECDKLVDRGPDWIGKRAMRGNLLLTQGVLLFMNQSFVSGGGKLLSGLKHFKDIQQAASYAGVERPLVRSFALWVAGSANLAISGLPQVMLQVVKWMTNLQGDREEALKDLERGWREGGLMAAACSNTFMNSVLDVNNRCLRSTPEQVALVDEMLRWADREYPGSIFFVQLQALVQARRRNAEGAYKILKEAMDASEPLPAIWLVGHGLLCSQALAMLDWARAAEHARAVIEVQKTAVRRAHIPENAFVAMLCHLKVGEEAAAREMLALLRQLAREKKKDWPVGDAEAFRVSAPAPSAKVLEAHEATLAEPKEAWQPSLHLWEMMVLHQQYVRNMSLETAQAFLDELRAYVAASDDPSLQCRGLLCLADALLQAACPPAEAVQVCEQGLALVSRLNAAAKEHGCEPYLQYVRARALFNQGSVLEATDALRKLETFRKHRTYLLLSFRLAEIRRSLGEQLGSSFRELTVKAWGTAEVCFQVPADLEGEEVSWSCSVKDKNLTFKVHFRPAGQSAWTQLEVAERHEAEHGPWMGAFKPAGAGTLKLTFDNSFSWAKKKEALYQVSPETLAQCPA